MAGFDRKIWRIKPPPGVQLEQNLWAPNRLAVPFNEIGLDTFQNYAKNPNGISPPGTLVNTPTIVNGPNGPMLSFTNSNQFLTFAVAYAADMIPSGTECTFLFGYNKRDATLRNENTFGENGAPGRVNLNLPWSDGHIYWDWNGTTTGTNRLDISGVSVQGYHIWAFTVGARGMEGWKDGQLIGSNSAAQSRSGSNFNFNLGSDGSNGSDLADWDFIYCWDRQLPESLIQQLSVLPFSVFKRHRTALFAGYVSFGPTAIDITLSDTITLSDSIAENSAAILEVTASDSIALDDSISTFLIVVLTEILSDSLALGDGISIGLDFVLQFNDSLNFSDSINFNDFQIVVITGDGLNLSDSFVISGDSPLVFNDRLILLDFAFVDAPASTSNLGDSYTLSDSAQVVLEINLSVSDSIVIDDTPGLFLTEVLQEVFNDDFNFSDSIELFLSTSDTSYLRNYLNDVQGIRTPENITPDPDENPNVLNSYLRRYLNDVT